MSSSKSDSEVDDRKFILVPKVFGVGVDITKVERLQRFFDGNEYKTKRFLTGVFHPSEIEAFYRKNEKSAMGGVSPRLQYLASRWALKEALVKASGCTHLIYNEIYLEKPLKSTEGEEETSPQNGQDTDEELQRVQKKLKPQLMVSGEKNKKLLFEDIGIIEDGGMHASLSHEENYSVAVVTLEKL